MLVDHPLSFSPDANSNQDSIEPTHVTVLLCVSVLDARAQAQAAYALHQRVAVTNETD